MAQIKRRLTEFRVLAYGKNPPFANGPLSFHDSIRELMFRDAGSSYGSDRKLDEDENALDLGGIKVTTLNANQWNNQPQFESISETLQYIEFGGATQEGANAVMANGSQVNNSANALGGFYIRNRSFPRNCKVAKRRGDGAPEGEAKFKNLMFRQVKPALQEGQALGWETVQSFDSKVTQISFRNPLPNQTAEAHSDKLEDNQCFKLRYRFIERTPDHEGRAGQRVIWGSVWSLVCREDDKGSVVISLERFENKKWVIVRIFDKEAMSKFEGDLVIAVEIIAGRMVLTFNDKNKYDILDFLRNPVTDTYKVRNCYWNAAPLKFSLYGVRVRIGIEFLAPTEDDEKTPLRGAYIRFIKRNVKPNTFTVSVVSAGWKPKGTTVIHGNREITKKGFRYSTSLHCSRKYSPFVSAVSGRCYNLDSNDLGVPLMDITPAFLNGSMEDAAPEKSENGVTATLNFSRNILNSLGAQAAVDWRDWISKFCAVSFETRYKLSDETYTPWVGRLFYVTDETLTTGGPNDYKGRVELHDPTIFMTGNFAPIDHRYVKDLAMLMALKNDETGGPLFGGDIVKYFLEMVFGSGVASQLNGNGDPLRFFPEHHYPLIDPENDTVGYVFAFGPPTQSNELLPLQWGESVMSQLQSVVASKDFGMFLWEHIPSENGELVGYPVPVYADYREWTRNMPVHDLYDGDYNSGDAGLIMTAIETVRRANLSYNRTLVWSNPPKTPQNLPFPAVFAAEARLPADDANSVENTGVEVTYIKKEDKFAYFPEAVVAYGAAFLGRLRGISPEWPTVTVRSAGEIRWGHIVRLHMGKTGQNGEYSDASMGLDGRAFRVLKVSHKFDKVNMGDKMHVCTLTLFPLLQGIGNT